MDQRSITPGLIDEVRIGRENVTIRYPVGLPGSSFGRFCGFTPNNASASFSVYSAPSVQLIPLIVELVSGDGTPRFVVYVLRLQRPTAIEVVDAGEQNTRVTATFATRRTTLVGVGQVGGHTYFHRISILAVIAFARSAARIWQHGTSGIGRLLAIADRQVKRVLAVCDSLSICTVQITPQIDRKLLPHDQFIAFAIECEPAFDNNARRHFRVAFLAANLFELAAQFFELLFYLLKLSCGSLVSRVSFHFQFLALDLQFLQSRQKLFQLFVALGNARLFVRFGDHSESTDHAVTVQAAIVELELFPKVVLLSLEVRHAEHLTVEIVEPLQVGERGADRVVAVAARLGWVIGPWWVLHVTFLTHRVLLTRIGVGLVVLSIRIGSHCFHSITVLTPTTVVSPGTMPERAPLGPGHNTLIRLRRMFPPDLPRTGGANEPKTVSTPTADHVPSTKPSPPTRRFPIVCAGF